MINLKVLIQDKAGETDLSVTFDAANSPSPTAHELQLASTFIQDLIANAKDEDAIIINRNFPLAKDVYHCPACGARVIFIEHGSSNMKPEALPKPGAPALCDGCGAFLQLTEGAPIIMPREDFDRLPPAVRAFMTAMQAKIRQSISGKKLSPDETGTRQN